MKEKVWTARGQMLPEDKEIIMAVVEHNRTAARIFVTGEVSMDCIGEVASAFLTSINAVYVGDVVYSKDKGMQPLGVEPLFVETKNETIRMTRFEPEVVWKWCFNPDILIKLIEAECSRFGVAMNPWDMEYLDFYQSMIWALRNKVGDAVPVVKKPGTLDAFYNAVYLSCLLLFDKPGYMAVPVAEHFAQASAANFLKTTKYQPLNEAERKEVKILRERFSDIQAVTNPEISFIIGLYEKGARK